MSPVNVPAIGAYIRDQREQAKISLRQLAQAAGVSNPYLSQIERGLRRPSADILQQIARGLRISAEALYVQAGFLEDRPPGAGVHDAVLTDPELTERQKQMLLEVYESFRKETAADNRQQAVLIGEIELAGGSAEPAGTPADAPSPAEAADVAAAESWAEDPPPDDPGTRTADGTGAAAGDGASPAPEHRHDQVA
jgi:transcriptional regulator with XRE-family HTH domain